MTTTIYMAAGGLLSLFFTNVLINAFVNNRTKNKFAENDPPPTILYLKGIMIICFALLIPELIETFHSYLKITENDVSRTTLLDRSSFFSLFFGSTLAAYLVCYWLAVFSYAIFSKGAQLFKETSNGNLMAVLFFGAILVSFSLGMKSVLFGILELIIPYPSIPIYN